MLLSTSTGRIKLEIFLKPFSRETWYLNTAFVVICVFIMRVIMKREETSETKERYSGAMVLTVGIVAQQGNGGAEARPGSVGR